MVSVLVLYHSQEYGNTKAMAKAVAAGAQTAGAKVTLINTNEQRIDIEEFRKFDVVAFGSPDYYSYIAGGLKTFVDDLYITRKSNRQGLEDKPYGLFYSHGGGGRVRDPFEKLFMMMKIGSKVGETIESYGSPDDNVLKACHELGKQLVTNVEKKKS
ncbi:MAG: flavodoxin family protein [Candidatus Heimdallarchaeota archaeon]